ncbi:hypothetical protein [Chengkuizengella marina]|uniref:DUF5668 domain-containing protein n=1 Tax=Chengkuizengella marina TaxID=2507566 RepID=A0A6N9Q3X7_9BACL|nr:hypothetical protein [Chengkuizengella marina]NBI29394.1 hypothetical protein [Chengkuizengella marina]
MGRNRATLGLLIITIGIILILFKLNTFDFVFDFSWPLIFIFVSIVFHVLFFIRTFPSGVLIPGGILGTYGLLFLFLNITNWEYLQYLWPIFIFGVAVGLFEYYFFSRQNPKDALTAGFVLTIISIVFMVFTLLYTIGIYLLAGILILFGTWMIFGRR